MNTKLPLAIIGLRISAVLYALVFFCFLIPACISVPELEMPKWAFALMAAFVFPFILLPEIIIYYLKRGRFWAWICGIIMGGLYTPSLFLPLGVMILVGLLSEGTRMMFHPPQKTA